MQVDFSIAPAKPDLDWVNAFSQCISRLRPDRQHPWAVQQALLAYGSTWLLEADEAAMLWDSAVRGASSQPAGTGSVTLPKPAGS